MSLAQRSHASRRDRRNQSALPYSRPKEQSNQASFSILGGLFNWFKLLAGGEEEDTAHQTANGLPNSAAATLRERTADTIDDETAPATLAPAQLPPPPPSRLTQATPSMSSLPGTYVPTPSVSASNSFNSLQQLQPTASTSTIAPPPRAPRVSTSPLLDQVGTPADNIATVSAFLAGKNGQPLNRVEVAGLVSLLQNSMPDEEPREPFRFSTSPSTPIEPSSSGLNGAAPGSEQPRKTLAKNPNGTYRWQGAGSARPRNRYHSAAFGPSRSTPVRLKITPEQSTTDSKRRRVGESAAASTSQRTPAPASTARPSTSANATASGSGMNGTSKARPSSSSTFLTVPGAPQPSSSAPKTNGATAPPTTPARIRTTVKSAPAVPSPLRQTWGQTDSPSPPANKPTRAANVMTELIKGVTPPKKQAFANPYQAALPAPLVNRPKKPAGRKRAAAAKAEAAAKAAAEAEAKAKEEAEKRKEIEMTSEEIIMATVPPGAKRSRPPPDFEKPKKVSPPSPSSHRNARFNSTMLVSVFGNGSPSSEPLSVVIEEVPDEDEPSPKKKARRHNVPLPDISPVRPPSATLVEVTEDTEMSKEDSTPVIQPSQVIEPENGHRSPSPSAAAPTATIPNPFNKLKYSAPPKAPSKLRFSIRPEDQTKEQDEKTGSGSYIDRNLGLATPAPSMRSVPVNGLSTAFSVGRPSAAPKKPSFQTESEVKDWVKVLTPTELPTYNFTVAMSSPGAGPSTFKAREAAKAASMVTLPKFDFTSSAVAKAPAAKSFDWAAAGMKPPAQPADGSWTCGTCGCTTPAANAKCVACETPRPAETKAAAVQGFNWAAAGLKKPELSDRWTCSTCLLSNADSVSECIVCKEPRS